MNNKKSERIKKAIVAMLKSNPGVPVDRKEISHALNITKKEYHAFASGLQELVREGRVVHVKKYLYAYPPKKQRLTGELRTTRAGFGFVNFPDEEFEVFVAQPNLNTAFDRDVVEVQLYAASKGKRLEGFVARVVDRFRSHIVGTYHKTEYYSYVVPDDPRVYRDIIVQAEKAMNAQDGQKVLVSFDRWERDQHNPEGTIVEILGQPDDPGVDIVSVAYSYNLPVKFSAQLEAEAAELSRQKKSDVPKDRDDLRDLICFTIDPSDAKDFDDAISLTTLSNGNRELGVHIADVSYFVPVGSNVDKEAFKRGTSVYLVDRVIPMLPEVLSNDLCSLKPNVDRMAYSCFMELDQNHEVINYRIRPSVINSNRRFTYEEVQEILDNNISDQLGDVLRKMDRLRHDLMEKRFTGGGIDFETPEVRFILDERGQPSEIIPKKRLNSHRMVEEFMLLANQTVARHVRNISPQKNNILPFIYRVHEKPDQDKMAHFFEFLSALNIPFKPVKQVTSKYFQQLLKSIKGSKEEIIIEEVALRSMMKAVYSEKNIGHFGLGFSDYTHFTSPIRRYPDLVVHRLLKQYATAEGRKADGLEKQLKEIARQSSRMERLAVEAERESIKLKQAEYINRYIGEAFDGLISGVTAFAIFVELKETFIEGMIHIAEMKDDYYIFDEKTHSMVGRDTEQTIRLGDEVKIRVEEVDLEKKQISFSLLENYSDEPGRSKLRQPADSSEKGGTKRRRRRKKR